MQHLTEQHHTLAVTGATGFIGRRLCEVAAEKAFDVRRAFRRDDGRGGVVVGDLGPDTDWSSVLEGVDAIVHLAARVHVMDEEAEDPLAEFRLVNVAGTENLARQAAEAGLKRLVFLSSVKVNGESLFMHLNDYKAFKRVLPSKIFEYAATGKPILAGVGGYAAEFIESNVPNASIFSPCEAGQALSSIKDLQINQTERAEFIRNYSREFISKQMVEEMLSIFEDNQK